ncbi:hypothetical protein HDU93_001776 [Gonapodya sp. JEL0774]|nr:hypothetical protein HDU93_001776 [Gonapodya sp. JEL0774]
MPPPMTLADLSLEILIHIVDILPIHSRLRCLSTSRSVRQHISVPVVWKRLDFSEFVGRSDFSFGDDNYSEFLQRLCSWTGRTSTTGMIRDVVFDSTHVTEEAIINLIRRSDGIEWTSVRNCLLLDLRDLGRLIDLYKVQKSRSDGIEYSDATLGLPQLVLDDNENAWFRAPKVIQSMSSRQRPPSPLPQNSHASNSVHNHLMAAVNSTSSQPTQSA